MTGNWRFPRSRSCNPSDNATFEHFLHDPWRSLATVGDEPGIANGFAPTVSRIEPDRALLGAIAVGPWSVAVAHVAAVGFVFVAQRAADTAGTVDDATNSMVDAIWVGDEPANIIASPDGASVGVAHTRGDPYADFVAPPEGRAAFRHEIMVVDAATGAVTATADLCHAAAGGGPVVGLRDLLLVDGALYTTSEGTDQVLCRRSVVATSSV